MSLEIIGAGLQRTGTVTLKHALDCLGFSPCYHGFEDVNQLTVQLRAISSEPINWEAVLGNHRAAVDLPVSIYYRELAERYPSAKIILTVRDPGEWYGSIQHLWELNYNDDELRGSRAWSDLQEKIDASDYGARIKSMFKSRDRESMISTYMERVAEAQATIPANRLLVYNVRDGWGPLCRFLEVPIPSVQFPHVNSRSSLQSSMDRFLGDLIRVI